MKYTISPRDAADALTAIRDILFRVEPTDPDNDCPTLDPDKELDYSDALQAIAGAFQALDLAPVRGDEPASSIGIAPAPAPSEYGEARAQNAFDLIQERKARRTR